MKGEITVRAECLMPEKLLERAVAQGARFSEVRLEDGNALLIRCDAASAQILLEQCQRFRLPARTLSRRGKSALVDRMRARRTLPLGLIVCAALCWLFLSRVWLIDVGFTGEAARLGDPAALRSAAQARGVYPGMARSVDLDALGQELRADGGDYSHVGVSLRGIRLLIEAVPEVPSPSLYDVDAPRDLVAERDGIVLSATARSGELCVQPGDAVLRGQTLIRGEEKLSGEETRPIAALGEVIVRAWFTGEASLPMVKTVAEDTGRSAVAAKLVTPWFSLPIAQGGAFARERVTREYLPIGGLFLPVEIERVTHCEVAERDVPLDEALLRARLEALANADAMDILCREGPGAYEIRGRWTDFQRSGDTLTARAVIEISADAAVTREALINK